MHYNKCLVDSSGVSFSPHLFSWVTEMQPRVDKDNWVCNSRWERRSAEIGAGAKKASGSGLFWGGPDVWTLPATDGASSCRKCELQPWTHPERRRRHLLSRVYLIMTPPASLPPRFTQFAHNNANIRPTYADRCLSRVLSWYYINHAFILRHYTLFSFPKAFLLIGTVLAPLVVESLT